MKVKVKLFGKLGQLASGYDESQGLDMELNDGADVQDLLNQLGVPAEHCVVAVSGRICKTTNDKLLEADSVNIYKLVHGG